MERMEPLSPGVTATGRATGRSHGGTELEDVSRAAAGDVRAFERLYRAHVGRIHALARRMMGDADAGEITQDVFVRAWEKLATFRGEAAFGTWLHRVAINVIMAQRAKLATRRSRFVEDEIALESAPAPRGRADERMDFEGALGRLPEGARQVFVLHDVEGFRHEEIGRMLGVTTGTSKAQLHRARMLLRRHMDR
jgi:RNA polymerase sigma-70 factor (ECF subfamily)